MQVGRSFTSILSKSLWKVAESKSMRVDTSFYGTVMRAIILLAWWRLKNVILNRFKRNNYLVRQQPSLINWCRVIVYPTEEVELEDLSNCSVSEIPRYTCPTINLSILKTVLLDVGQVYCGFCETALFAHQSHLCRNQQINIPVAPSDV